MATAYISRTPAGVGDLRKWTFSAWVKRCGLGGSQAIITWFGVSASYTTQLRFDSDNTINFYQYYGGYTARLATTRLFRDIGAWYHIVAVWDTDNAEAGDRMKLYVNGVEETVFGTDTNPTLNLDSYANSTNEFTIGAKAAAEYFDGDMSHVQFVNGAALAPTEFGEVDSTSGIWKIKTSAYATPGTNGYFLKMEDRTNLDLDSSSNAYTFATTGTLTATYDTPDNNFCTINHLNRQSGSDGDIIYTNGNTTIYDNGANWRSAYGTQGDNTAKYYFETKIVGASGNWWSGVVDASQMSETDEKFVAQTRGYGVNASGNRGNSGSEASWTGEIATAQNEVVMVAVDMVNGKIYFGSEGVWMASGDPTSGATGTGAAYSITTGHTYLPAFSLYSVTAGVSPNFGNGYFGTTAITSEGTNASGVGSFEFDVPTGYTAWSTKGFNV